MFLIFVSLRTSKGRSEHRVRQEVVGYFSENICNDLSFPDSPDSPGFTSIGKRSISLLNKKSTFITSNKCKNQHFIHE
jgi:hypothetical protein